MDPCAFEPTGRASETLQSARTIIRLRTAIIEMIALVLAIMIAIAIVLVHVLEIVMLAIL